MTCSQAGEHLHRTPPEGWGQLPQAVREHLEKCAPCRKVWDFLTRHDSSERVAPEVEAKIKSSVVGSLEAVRPLPGARLTAAFLLIYAALSGIFIAITGVGGALEMGAFRFAAILGVVGAVILLLSVTLSREMVPGSPRLLTPARLFLSLLAALFLAVTVAFPWDVSGTFLPQSWMCFRTGLMYSFPAAALISLLLRRGAVLSLGVAGAGAGLMAGLVGMTVLHFGCSLHTAPHIAMVHLGIALAVALLGYALGHYLPLFVGRSGR